MFVLGHRITGSVQASINAVAIRLPTRSFATAGERASARSAPGRSTAARAGE